MSFVRTLTGDIDPQEMGFTYSHEHLVCIPPYWRERGEDDLLLDDKEKTKRDVLDFKRHGGRTIVDATAVDYGRRVEEVKAIAEETGIYVIGTAGFKKSFLWSAKVPERLKRVIGDYETYHRWIDEASVHQMAEFVIREVEGMRARLARAAR